MDVERIRQQSPYRRPQQQHVQQFVTSRDVIDDADDDDDIADVIMDNVDDQLSRVRPKRQIPSVSPSRRRADESRGLRGRNDTGNDVTAATTQRRQQRQAVRLSCSADKSPGAGTATVDGHDTGLGSISVDGSDIETDNILHGLTTSFTDADFPTNDQSMDSCRRRLALIDGEMERQIDARFRETMANITGDVQRNQQQRPAAQDNFDIESVQTDDIENEFRKTLIDLEILPPSVQTAKIPASPQLRKPAAVTESIRRRHDSSIASNDNDTADEEGDNMSVKTEDFEAQFHRSSGSVKQVAHTPVPTFDPFIVDSDLETVKSQLVHDTFQTVLARNEQVSGGNRAQSSVFQRKMPSTLSSRRKREASPSSDIDIDLDDIRPVERNREPNRALMDDIEKWKKALQQQPADRRSSAERSKIAAKVPAVSRLQPAAFVRAPTSRLVAARQALENKTDYEVSCRLKQELSKLQSQIKQALQTKQAVQQTNDRLQALASQHQLDVMAAERKIKESRSAAETTRSELMKMELKRDAARRELESLTAEVDNRRLQLQRLAVQEKSTADDQMSISETRSNADAVDERQQLELKLGELQQQYSRLQTEKTDEKLRLENIQQDVRAKEAELQMLTNDKEQLRTKVAEMETLLRKTEKEKHEIMQRKTEELEVSKSEVRDQLIQNREKFSRELAELRNTVDDLTNQLGVSRQENRRKDELNLQLREQLDKLSCELEQQNQLHSNLLEENICSLRGIIKEKETAVNAVRDQAQDEKRVALEEVRRTLSADHQRSLQQLEHQLTGQLTALQGQLSGKDVELQVLRDRIREQEDWMSQMAERIRQENYDKMQEALEAERSRIEAEKSEQLNTQLESMKDEMVRNGRQLREELQREKDIAQSYRQQIDTLEQELEKVRRACQNACRETLQMEFDEQLHHPTDKLHYQEMVEQTTEKLNDVVRKQRDELERLRQENTELNIHWQERIAAIEKNDRRLCDELNEQCNRIARMLNEPATLNSSINSSSSNKSMTRSRSPSRKTRSVDARTSLTSIATNLANWCEKLRDRLTEQQQQVDEHNAVVARTNKSTKEEIETLKTRLQEEKYHALETLKNRLIKEHLDEVEKLHKSYGKGKGLHMALREKDRELQEIQQNMKTWKDQTLEKLAQKFKEEMNRELARRNLRQSSDAERINSLLLADSRHSSIHKPTVRHSSSLQLDNFLSSPSGGHHLMSASASGQPTLLAEKLGASVPDLTAITSPVAPHKLRHMTRSSTGVVERSGSLLQVRQLQLQAQRAEANWKLADERARNNEHLLNQKMIELAKLQSLVTQQTKELAQLQRAYSKLQNKAATLASASAVRPTSKHHMQMVN